MVTTGIWRLEPDEALIIELTDPEADFWAFQLASSLWHTLDYANRFTSINQAQAIADDDGKFRIVLTHRDPGVANWLDTTDLSTACSSCASAGRPRLQPRPHAW